MILGGAGDDIITDKGGDDNMQGQDGNDAIHGGNGINLILGGFGNDFIVTGEDSRRPSAARATTSSSAVKPDEDDVRQRRRRLDRARHGRRQCRRQLRPVRGLDSIIGNDVFMGDTVSDRMDGEGGDDIMIGNGGQGDRYSAQSGFDWAIFQHPTLGATVDLQHPRLR